MATSGTCNAYEMAVIIFHVSIYMARLCILYSVMAVLCNTVFHRRLEREFGAVCVFSLVGNVFYWRDTIALALLAYSCPIA